MTTRLTTVLDVLTRVYDALDPDVAVSALEGDLSLMFDGGRITYDAMSLDEKAADGLTHEQRQQLVRDYFATLPPEEATLVRELFRRGLETCDRVRSALSDTLKALAALDVGKARELMANVADLNVTRLRIHEQLRARNCDIEVMLAGHKLDAIAQRCVAGIDAATVLQECRVSTDMIAALARIGPDSQDFGHHWGKIAESVREVVQAGDYHCDEEHLIEYIRLLVGERVIAQSPELLNTFGTVDQLQQARQLFFTRHIQTVVAPEVGYAIIHTDTGHQIVVKRVADALVARGFARPDKGGLVSTEADLTRAREAGVGVCDFCSADFGIRHFDVPDFEMEQGHTSTGGWCACEACARLIDARDREALAQRVIRMLVTEPTACALTRIQRLGADVRTVDERKAAIRRVQDKFWLHWLAVNRATEHIGYEDYAPGITDLRERVMAGAKDVLSRMPGPQWDAWFSDLELFHARASRHEFSRAQVSEVMAALRTGGAESMAADTPEKRKLKRDMLETLAKYEALYGSYLLGPAHVQALEHQWLAYKVNALMIRRVPDPQVGALHHVTVDALRAAETYCWAPDTTQAVAGVGAGIPVDCALSATALGDLGAPGRAGWWWFQTPVPIITTQRGADVEPVVALLWKREFPPNKPARIWMSTFVLQSLSLNGRPTLAGCPTTSFYWDDGETLAVLPDSLRRGYGEAWNGARKAGYEAASMEQTIEASMWFARFFMAASMWLRQRIVVESHGTESVRAATKRIQREFKLDDRPRVRVIELRRAEREMVARATAAGAQTASGRKLSVRFVVGGLFGFTRNQWFPSTQTHAPKWIQPYWKGPKDAPFKSSSSVYVVRR